MSQLQVSSTAELKILATVPAANRVEARCIEGRLHKYFSASNVRGEWFRDVEVEDFIDRGNAIIEKIREKKAKKKANITQNKTQNNT